MIEFFLEHPLRLALVGAHFLPYVLLAWGYALYRIVRARMTRGEKFLLGFIAAYLVVELVQCLGSGTTPLTGPLTEANMGIPRYFGVLAPLIWIFAAKLLADIWDACAVGIGRWILRLLVVGGILWVVFTESIPVLSTFMYHDSEYDTRIACQRIAPIIRDDYAGPARQREVKRTLAEYFTGNRPVVFSDFGAAAWMVRGDSGGATQTECPYRDDYLFLRAIKGYRGQTEPDPKVYEYMTSVPGGLNYEWRLYRRRTTRHRRRR